MFPDRWLAGLLLAAAALAPYLAGLHHDWVYDDHGVIVENPFLERSDAWPRVLTLQTLRDPDVVDGQRPLVVATYLLDRAAWGVHPAGFRATNLALHALAAWLVFVLFRRVAGARAGFIAAALFAVHPLSVEAVISPAFREDLLYTVFGLLFLLAGWSREATAARLAAGALALALAVLSKEAAAVLPLVLLAGWWLDPSIRPPRRAMVAGALVALAIAGVLVALMAAGRPVQAVGGAWNGLSLRGAEGWWTAPWLAVRMVFQMVWPHPLSVDYVIDPVRGAGDPRWWLAWLALAALAAATVRARENRAVTLAALWMALLFLPVSNLVPLYNPVADRYAYGILPGFTLAVAALLLRAGRYAAPLLAVLLVAGAWATVDRVRDWRDDRTLWTAALDVEPRSARAHTWLGLLDLHENRLEEATARFVTAEALNPHDPSPKVNRAIALGTAGDLAGAEALLREVLAVRPDHPAALRNLEKCLDLQGRSGEGGGVPR